MLNGEKLFLTKLLGGDSQKTYTKLKAKGLASKFFAPIYRPTLDFVDEYLARYSQLPSKAELLDKFPKFKEDTLFSSEVPGAALEALYDSVVTESLRTDLQDNLQNVIASYNAENSDPYKVLAEISKVSSALTGKFINSKAEMSTFAEAAPSLLDELEGRLIAPPGHASALLFVEDQSKGWQPGELTTFAAPTGVGKTWMLTLNAVTITTGNPFHFYDKLTLPSGLIMPSREEKLARRKRVLFLSLEMPVRAIMKRLAALYARVSYPRYKNGTMTDEERKRLKKVLEFMGADATGDSIGANLRVIGPDKATTPEAVHAAAVDFGADVVIVDGFYLMPGAGDERWQKVEGNMQQLRLYSLLGNRHYMLATQLKQKTGRSLASTDIDSLSFSSSIGHDSSNVFALVQTKNDASGNIMYVSVLKMRDGVPGQEYIYNWDHQEGVYTQNGLVVEETFNSFSID